MHVPRAWWVVAHFVACPNKDFVVRYQLAGAAPSVAILPHRDAQRGGHFLLMIQPKANMSRAEIAPREYIFVIDRSGSQWGFPLEQSKAAVRKCLANVGPRDTFNLIAFESGVATFAPRAVAATRGNVESALSWIDHRRPVTGCPRARIDPTPRGAIIGPHWPLGEARRQAS